MLAEDENHGLAQSSATCGIIIDGRYRLDECFDEGGVGAVWRATQLTVGRTVVVKLLHRHLRASRESIARFELEARALASMRHPGCVTLFDFGWSDELGAHYMVMEEIDGVPLSRALASGLPTADALEACAATCAALDHAHGRGVLHRDLKPSNIMILTRDEPRAKILDFGLARLFDTDALLPRSEPLSMAGRVYGTPAYMSPEQCEGVEGLGPQCDIYALGVILYEILEGGLPFPDHSAVGTLLAHVQYDVPRPTNQEVSESLRDLIVRMTARDQAERFCDLDAIRVALEVEVARLRAGGDGIAYADQAGAAECEGLGAETTFPDTPPSVSVGERDLVPTLIGAPPFARRLGDNDRATSTFVSPRFALRRRARRAASRIRPLRAVAALSLIALAVVTLAFRDPWSSTHPASPLVVEKALYEPVPSAVASIATVSMEPVLTSELVPAPAELITVPQERTEARPADASREPAALSAERAVKRSPATGALSKSPPAPSEDRARRPATLKLPF